MPLTLSLKLEQIARRTAGVAGALLGAAALSATATAQTKVFQEIGGFLAIEVESGAPVGMWAEETQWAGFAGDSYFRWSGPNQFSTPGNSVLRYTFDIANGGTFQFRLRNRHNDPNSSEENDVWVRLDGGAWIKCYSNAGPPTVNVWTWHSIFEPNSSTHVVPSYALSNGRHVLEFSGRSNNFMIDRFHMFHAGHAHGENANAPESPFDDATAYCTATTTPAGCVPSIGKVGTYASVSESVAYSIVANNIPNQSYGALLYSMNQGSTPFHGSTLCIGGANLERTRVVGAGGSLTGHDCTGTLAIDFNEVIQAPNASLHLENGATIFSQFVFRNPNSATGVGVSNALRFTIQR